MAGRVVQQLRALVQTDEATTDSTEKIDHEHAPNGAALLPTLQEAHALTAELVLRCVVD